MNRVIIVDMNDKQSIEQARTLNKHFERLGLILKSTKQIGFDKFKLSYVQPQELIQ